MCLVGAYSIFLMFSGDRFLTVISGCAAFGAFCVGGTLGASALEVWRNHEPAIVIDAHGLNDLRGKTGLIPWHDIESVQLDNDEQRILMNVVRGVAHSRRRFASTTRRLLAGADYTIALGGLSYNHHELAKSLAEHHRQGKVLNVSKAAESDA